MLFLLFHFTVYPLLSLCFLVINVHILTNHKNYLLLNVMVLMSIATESQQLTVDKLQQVIYLKRLYI